MELHNRVTELASDIHALSRRLHPSVLDRLGVVAAIRAICEQVSTHRGIAITFNGNAIDQSIPKDIGLCLYRVTEEAITNAIKHGEATELHIELANGKAGVRLIIEDTGRGFDILGSTDG